MGTGRPAPKKRAAMKFFDEIAARYATPEEGEQAIKDMTLREIARKLGDEIEGGAHASSAMDWKTDWLIGRDDRVREEERARAYFRFSTEINANLYRVHPDARGFALVSAFALDKFVFQGATEPKRRTETGAAWTGRWSFTVLLRRDLWRVREPDRPVLMAAARELDAVLVDDSTTTPPDGANSAAWMDALNQVAHPELLPFTNTDEEVNSGA